MLLRREHKQKYFFIGSNLYLLKVLSTQFNKSPCFFLSNFLRQFNECTETQFHLLKQSIPWEAPKGFLLSQWPPQFASRPPNLTKFLFSPFLRLRQQQLVFRQLSIFDFLYIQSKVLRPLTYQNYQQRRHKMVTFLEKQQ